MGIKEIIRSVLTFLHLDLTKNLEYDRLTRAIMKREIRKGSNCLDIGCHKGEILDIILHFAPKGHHFAFEPIPSFFTNLEKRFGGKVTLYPYALSDEEKISTFNYVKNAPAYSGINKRRYDIKNPEIEEIRVEVKRLDDVIPSKMRIDFVKIDVEGGEFGVLKGGKELLKKWQPVIVFESGLGASDYYGTKPDELFGFISRELGLQISTLKDYISRKKPLSLEDFRKTFDTNSEYYFVAHPAQG